MANYIVCTTKPWNVEAFYRHTSALPGKWHLITEKEHLTMERVRAIKPRYIFFPHWSWIVPSEILAVAECVCFHMTDLPYGRGGSPLQNLISRGHKETKLSALRMVAELDAGPVYLKRSLSLAGRAQDIFERAAELVYQIIADMIAEQPTPQPQDGEVIEFQRRTPEMSLLPDDGDIEKLYDHIRMLDAESYPPAFLDYGGFRFVFKNPHLKKDGSLRADVEICALTEKGKT